MGNPHQEPRGTGRAKCCWPGCGISSTSAARWTCCATASNCWACGSRCKLAQFKPALAINPDILARYAANRLRVVRQVRYSLHNENCIDLVLFLNGIPVATVELKTDFTQSIGDAIDQYRFDRLPSPKGQAPEPLLSFPSGALVHFAVSNNEVYMVTKLDGPATRFPAVQSGQRRRGGQSGEPAGRPSHGLSLGTGVGTRKLAGDPGPLPHRPTR